MSPGRLTGLEISMALDYKPKLFRPHKPDRNNLTIATTAKHISDIVSVLGSLSSNRTPAP